MATPKLQVIGRVCGNIVHLNGVNYADTYRGRYPVYEYPHNEQTIPVIQFSPAEPLFAIDSLPPGVSHNIDTSLSPFQALDGATISLEKLNEKRSQVLFCTSYLFLLSTIYPLLRSIFGENTDWDYGIVMFQLFCTFGISFWIEYAMAIISQPNSKVVLSLYFILKGLPLFLSGTSFMLETIIRNPNPHLLPSIVGLRNASDKVTTTILQLQVLPEFILLVSSCLSLWTRPLFFILYLVWIAYVRVPGFNLEQRSDPLRNPPLPSQQVKQ